MALFGTGDLYGAKNPFVKALLERGLDSSPIQSPWQGASRMAHALLAGMEMRDSKKQDSEMREALAGYLRGNAGDAAPAPTPQPQATPGPIGAIPQPQRMASLPAQQAMPAAPGIMSQSQPQMPKPPMGEQVIKQLGISVENLPPAPQSGPAPRQAQMDFSKMPTPMLYQLAMDKLKQGMAAPPDKIKMYEYAVKQGFKGSLQDWIANERAGGGEYGLTPIWGTDAQGNPSFIQPGKQGNPIQPKLPEGFKIARDPIKVDAGTHFVLIDPQTRQPIGQIPKDIAGAEKAKIQGGHQAALPTALQNVDLAIKDIEGLASTKGLDEVFGALNQFRPSWTMSSAGRDALARYKQVSGQAFLQAFEMIKGGGAITEVEGVKAGEAKARMDRAQDVETFKTALSDFLEATRTARKKLQERAGVSTAPSQPVPTPSPSSSDGWSIKPVQ